MFVQQTSRLIPNLLIGVLDGRDQTDVARLAAEELRNSESPHERHARSRAFGKMAKRVMKAKRSRQDG